MGLGIQLAIYALIFLSVGGAAWVGGQQLDRVLEQRRRLGEQRLSSERSESLIRKRETTNPFLRWIQSSSSISDADERQKLRHELSIAGFNQPAAPVWFVIVRFLLAIGLPLGFLLLRVLVQAPMTGGGVIFWALVLCGIGFLAPRTLLDRRIKSRRQNLEYQFPDALDLMVVCVEAGLSLDAAFVRVAQEVDRSHSRVAEEFARISEQLRAGRGRVETLRAFGERTGVPMVRSFAALVIQTEALGTSIAQTLRTYSAEMREGRFLKAEEKALRIPVLMTVPLVMCILPVIVTALMLPAIIDVVRVLVPAMTGMGHH